MLNSQYGQGSNHAALDARTARLINGFLRLFAGAQPANARTALGGGNVLLAEHRFGTPAFAPAANDQAIATALASSTILASGVAVFFRAFMADGVTAEWDGSIGVAAANLIVPSVNYQAGLDSLVQGLIMTAPLAGS